MVLPNYHNRGVGRLLVNVAEKFARMFSACLLEVKTLGPSKINSEYAITQEFYLKLGFIPVQELPDFWEDNPCLIMIKYLAVS